MRKYKTNKGKLFIIPLILCFAFFIFKVNKVRADVEYEIPEINVLAEVNDDGSLTMYREINYKFFSAFNGVYYDQKLDSDQKIKNVQVYLGSNYSLSHNFAEKNNFLRKSSSHKNKTYEVKNTGDGYRFKTYIHGNRGKKLTITYKYTITNAVQNGSDFAQLNFKIIGNKWNVPIESVYGKIHIPGESISFLKAWIHSKENSYIKTEKDEGIVQFTGDNILHGIEVRVLFPSKLTYTNENTSLSDESIDNIEKEENGTKFPPLLTIIRWGLVVIMVIILIIIIYFISRSVKQISKTGKLFFNIKPNFTLPTLNPVLAKFFVKKYTDLNGKSVSAYLLWLQSQHKVKIEKIKNKDKADYQVTLLEDKLKDQDSMLKFLFTFVGKNNVFKVSQMEAITSKFFDEEVEKWNKENKTVLKQKGLILPDYDEYINFSWGIAIFIVFWLLVIRFIAPVKFISLNVIGIIALLNLILVFIFKLFANSYTQKGYQLALKTMGFKRALKKVGHFEDKKLKDYVLWEEILPYAIIFGLSKKVIKELTEIIPQDQVFAEDFSYEDMTIFSELIADTTFNHSTVPDVDNSSSNFFEHDSDGFGGGSGGGAF